MTVSVEPVAILSDNYAWLLRDGATGAVAIVDPAEAGPIEAAIDRAGGRLDLILLTHHHADHVGATDPIRARYGAPVVGAAADAHRLPRLDRAVAEGDTVALGDSVARVIDTPGHTRGHIAYFFAEGEAGPVLLCGDTLFSLGCGRLIEGTAQEMFASLRKLAALPPDTLVCCGHEYTAANARFALSADPANAALQARAERVKALRAAGTPTLPSRLADELAENPFLRAPDAARFADLRARKDRF
ncbi:MAG: hydroxyacylglutathione hydrolase [Alphaproteobacteria bacterium]|nr:hydroxyacylglutathione hydrolase [Alphaproteobacteria bacterium]